MYRSGIRVVVVAGSFVKLVAMNRLMRVLSLLKLSSNVSGVSICMSDAEKIGTGRVPVS